MGHIYLVRHGQDEDNSQGILNGQRDGALTELGQSQAFAVTEKLKDNQIEAIYSSPLQRALETANIIAEGLGVDRVEIMEELIERDFGVLTGKPLADIPKYAKKTLQTDVVLYFLEVDGAEDFPALLERGKSVLEKVQGESTNKNILLVTHGDIGKMIRAAYHGWSWEDALKTPYFDNTGVLELHSGADILE